MDAAIFKFVFFLAVVVFMIVIIAVFLLLVKITFLISPEIVLFGIKMTPAVTLPY